MALKGRIDNSKALAADTYHVISAASTNGANIKSSGAQVVGWALTNNGTAMRYVKLYNKASSPTVGTDVPRVTFGIPAGSSANIVWEPPLAFETGLGIAITAGMADSDATAVAATEVAANIFYQ